MATSGLQSTGRAILALTQSGHRLAPAAVRVERSHLRTDGAKADQTALTVWLGRGPNLPGPSLQGSSARFVVRTAAVLVGAAALGAMGAIAAHREAERLKTAVPVVRIGG